MKIIYWLNQKLGWRVEQTSTSTFKLFNAFGYAGTFDSLGAACRADTAMSVEPLTTQSNSES